MPLQFSKKTVWITGASSGIGAALARELADRDATCVLSARREDRLREVADSCRNPDRHLVMPMDAVDFERHETAAAEVEERAGPVDLLVLSSGISQRGLALETSLDIERRILDVNFTGTISLAKAVARRMQPRGRGHLVVISSVLGRFGIGGSSCYAASKHALHGYFDSLRGELHGDGIGVTIVCPGYINTEITVHSLQADGTPFGIVDKDHTYGMEPQDCARAILKAVSRGRPTALIGGRETWAVPATRLFPSLGRLIARRYERS